MINVDSTENLARQSTFACYNVKSRSKIQYSSNPLDVAINVNIHLVSWLTASRHIPSQTLSFKNT